MSVLVIGSVSGVNAEVDAVPKALRTILYDASGNPLLAQTSPGRVMSVRVAKAFMGTYALTSWRILGIAATPQNLVSLENPAASGKLVAIRRLTCQTDSTALLATNPMQVIASRPTAGPSGGTIVPATKFDTSYAAAVAVFRCGTASDGGAATAITATAGDRIWQQFIDRMHTAAGVWIHPDNPELPNLCQEDPFILRAGEAILLQGVVAAANTTHFLINCCWDEYTA